MASSIFSTKYSIVLKYSIECIVLQYNAFLIVMYTVNKEGILLNQYGVRDQFFDRCSLHYSPKMRDHLLNEMGGRAD